ncbi:PREDICTED: trichohyalin-like [Camelina sativa]|uniref:Trichohyalin-like n=1 Tax=Camelina sativa TaxID=90675 RepID=A0ABM1QFU2_CAMSA|nr:PREDICTED: trichohyalin-like [Camelina sativa]
MELELGLKVTRTREDVSSSVDFRFSKDPFGPLVLSRETDSRFIIIIHIKGFKKEGTEIDINKEGNRITIQGRKPVEEMVMIRWMAWRKEGEFRVFKKAFRIPDTVVLDEIKARFDDDDATLTITMPKRVKGISGFNIEEEEEEEEERVVKGEVEEESTVIREETDVQSEKFETKIQREGEFGEKESQVLGEEQKDEEETGDDYLEKKSHQIDEQDKTMECIEEEEEELAESNKESEDSSSLRKHPDTEGRDSHEQTRHEEKENSQHSEATEIQREEEFGERESQVLGEEQKEEDETGDDYLEKRSHQIDEQDKILEEDEKELAESNEDSSLRKPPDIEGYEQTRHEEQDKKQKRVDEAESKSDDFGSTAFEGQEPDEQLDRTSKSGAKEKTKTDGDGDGDGLSKDQGIKEERERRNDKRKIQDIVQGNGEEDKKKIVKKQNIVKKEINNGDAKEKIDAKMGEVLASNFADIAMKTEDLESDEELDKTEKLVEKKDNAKVGAQSEDISLIKPTDFEGRDSHEQTRHEEQEYSQHSETEIQREEEFGERESQVLGEEQKDMEETNDDNLDKINQIEEQEEEKIVGDSNKENEDSSLRKLPDIQERDSHGQTRHEEQEQVVEQQDSQAETNSNDFGSRAFEDRIGEQKPHVTKSREMEKEKIDDDDVGLRKVQEVVKEPEIHNEKSKKREMVERDSHGQTRHEEQERDSHEQRGHEEQERVMEQQDSQAETTSNDFGSRAFEEIGEQKPHVTKSRDMETEAIDDDDVGGLRKVQEVEEPKIHNEESKKVLEGETSGHERGKFIKMDIEKRDAKEEVDEKMGEGFRPNIDRTQLVADNDIGETETKADEFESDKLKADEVHKIHELVEKKEDEGENANLRGKSKDISLKLQENEEQQSKGQKRQDKQEMIKELVEEKTPRADANAGNDIPKPVQAKTSDKGKEEKKSVKMEIKTGDAKEEVDAKMGGGFAPNIAATKFEEFESDKIDSDEVDKIQKLVEKKKGEEENAKVGTQSEDISSTKLQEIGEQQFQGQKQHEKQEKIRELVEEQTLEAEANIGNDIPKAVQEMKEPQEVELLEKTGDERKARKVKKKSVKMEINNEDGKEEVDEKMGQGFEPNVSETDDDFESNKLEADEVDKIHALFEKQQDEEENAEGGRQTEDISLKELQEIEEQQFHGKIKELVEEQTLEAETNIGNINPKPVAERSEGKHKFQEDTKNQPEEYKEKITKTNDPGARKVQEIIRKQELNEPAARSEKESKTRELVKSKTNDEGKEKKIAEKETKAETYVGNDILKPVQEISEGKHKILELSQEETKNQPEEYLKKIKETGKKINDAGTKKLQEIKQELNEPARSEKESKTQELVKNKRNEIAETETREQESNRPKILREQEKIQELAEEKTNFSKNGKAKDKDEIAEKKTEFCADDDDISSKFRDVEQQDSDAVKGQEEKDMIQELALEEKVSDGGKGIVAVLDTKAENDKSKKVQEIDQQQLHEEDRCGKQFQKLIVGEVSGRGEVDDIKIIEEEKEIRDSSRKGQETAKTDSELHNNREVCRSEEKKYDRPEKIEQELVNLNSQLEQDNVEDGDKNQEPVEEEIKDCKEEDGGAESKIKIDDDVVRKVQGVKEHESYGTEREHVSKIQELVEEKIGDHEEEEDVCDSLRKVDGGKAQELHEPKIHKERDKTRITGAEEPSCQEDENMVEPLTIKEDDNFVDVQEINKEQPEKLQSQEKPYKIQEVVEAGLNDHREEEKVTAKADLETERESSKKVEETEQQKYDGPKMQNTEDKKKNIAVEQKGTVEMRTKTKDGSLTKVQDDEDQESSKPYKRKIEDKTQKLVEMGTSDYREKVKKEDENDILRSQEDLDEFGRHSEQSNIPQLVEVEKVENIAELEGESYEDWTHEEREKRKDLVKEEAADLKDKHTGGDDHTDDKQEKIIVKAELKTEEDSSKRVQETEKQDEDELQRSMTQDKMQETEGKDKTRAMEENEIVERREKTINESLRKVREDEEDPQLGKQKRRGEEDRIHELVVETELNDYRGKVKKKDGDGVLRRSQETVKFDLGERERQFKQRRIHEPVEDEQTGEGKGEHDEEERYEKVAQAKTKVEHEINKKIGENKDSEPEKQELYKSEAVLKEEVGDREKEEENLVDGSATKIQETEKEELEMYKKQDMVLEDVTGDQKDEKAEEAAAVVASNANGSSRTVKTIEEESEEHMEKEKIPEISDPKVKETKEEVPKSRYVREIKELVTHVPELEGKTENCKDDGQGRRAEKGKQGKIVETMSPERFKSTSDDGIVRKKIQETKVQDSNEKKKQEQKGKIEETERRESSSHEVKLVTEDDSLRKGQEFLEKESNVSKKTEEDSSKRVQETEKQDEDELQRSMTQDKMQETEGKDKTRAMEENEIVERREKTINESLRKVREDEEDPQLGKQKRRGEEDRIHELVVETELNDYRGKVKKKDGDGVLRRSQETVKFDLGERERQFKQRRIHEPVEDEQTGEGKGEHDEEERYEKVAQAKTKVEHEINKKIGENKDSEPEKQELYKSEAVLKEEVGDREKEEENLVDGSATKIQETEKEELEMYKKQDMVLEDVTGDQKDEKAEEAAAVVASNANGSSRTVKTIEEESEEHMEKEKIPEISDPKVKETKEEVPKSRYVREIKELVTHVPELEGKTENCKDDGQGRRAEKGKQGKIVETMSPERFKSTSDDGIVRKKIQETKVQDSNEKKKQEQKGKIEETERRESSSHEVKLVTEDDSLRKGQEFLEKESNVSKSGQAEAETKINNVKSSEEEEHKKKIRKTMEEKSNAPEKEREANEKVAEERMQDKTDSSTKNQEIKEEEPYEFLRNGEHDKIPECHREEEKGMEQSEIEEMKRTTEDCSSRKVQQNKVQESDEVEKHRKLSEIQESSNTQESVGKETEKNREDEMNERGGYNAMLKEKSMASSESQDAEEKGSDQPKRYAEQELMTERERKEEYRIREGEQKENSKRMPQVASKANDSSSKKKHQELVEIETIDERIEELEEGNVVGKAETVDEYASSRTIHEQEERNSDKLEGHGEEDMSKKLAEQGTSDDKDAKEGNRAGEVWEEVETKIRADGFGKVRQIEEQETDKKLSDVEKDIRGKSKENKNQETKRNDNSSGSKTQANEKQESHEQKRNEEEVIEKEETIEEHDSSSKIHEHDEQKSDIMSENIAEEETSDDKEAKERNRAGAVLGEVLKIGEIEKHEQDKKQSFVDTSGKSKENKNQETKRTDDDISGNKTQKQESHKKKSHHDQDKKNPGLLGKETNSCINEDKENAEAEVSRKLKGVEKRESTKMVETHENRDDIKELVEEKTNNKEGQDKESIVTDVLAKAEDDELRKQDKSREQRLRDNLKYEETSKTETKRKDDNEQERIKEQGRIKELVQDRTHSCREKENKETEFEDSKKIQERDKEESTEPRRNEKRDKIQEPVDRETSDDDEEELEIEFEEEEEDWEAEVIQVTDSDHEDNNDIRNIKRIRLGFRLVGGSTLFMSLIVIVISFIHSKRKIRGYKF